jgi:DNA-binding NarL/FixJ family response regulator
MTVLIVDDHALVRQVIRSVIVDLATEIRECASAEEALTACADRSPDWVLMDIKLPGMDGLAAARAIAATWPAVRVCIVTNYDDLTLRVEASAAGASAYVVKENLLVLRDILRGAPAESDAAVRGAGSGGAGGTGAAGGGATGKGATAKGTVH